MTYTLDPMLERVSSPVVLLLPDGGTRRFEDGPAAAGATFERRYVVRELRAAGGELEVLLDEQAAPTINWVGEEAVGAGGVSFF